MHMVSQTRREAMMERSASFPECGVKNNTIYLKKLLFAYFHNTFLFPEGNNNYTTIVSSLT